MLKGHQSSAHPRRRRLKDCEGEEGWRKGGGPASCRARACVCVKGEPEKKEEESIGPEAARQASGRSTRVAAASVERRRSAGKAWGPGGPGGV